MSEKRDRRTPLGTRDGKRARARRVSLRTSSTPTPCSRTTRLSASRRPTHRDRPSRPGLHRPHAPASDRANTVKTVDGAEERRRRLQDQMLTGPGRRAAADLGQLRPRKDLQNREKASITLRALGTRSAFVGRRPRGSRIMCRWIFYYGEEVCIAKLIFGATHGLATMSEVRARHAPSPAAAEVARNLTGKDRKRDPGGPRPSTSRAGPPRPSSFPATGPPACRLARPRLTSRPTPRRRLSRALDARPVSSRLVRRAPDTPPGAR